jgi:hypothetical protein
VKEFGLLYRNGTRGTTRLDTFVCVGLIEPQIRMHIHNALP